jgi:geranylgeranyl reductase family protein
MKDLTIVGGGPAGSRLAILLSKDHDVSVIEEHDRSGTPLQCAGLVSLRTIDKITKKSILMEAKDFILHSPGGLRIALHAKEPKGAVIDRSLFDLSLAEHAADLGAEFNYGTRATDIAFDNESVKVKCKSGSGTMEIESSLLIGADGPRSIVRRLVTDKPQALLYKGAQFEGPDPSSKDGTVEMWIGNKVAPGFFVWKIPTGDTIRVGLCTLSEDSPMSLLKIFVNSNFPELKIKERQSGLIPLGPIGKLSKGRLALVGDAGGQIKPVTGGGLFLSRRAAEMLAGAVAESGARPEAVAAYEKAYSGEFGTEISRAWMLRKLMNRLSDRKLDKAVEMLSDPRIQQVLQDLGDIDAPGEMASAILKKTPKLIGFAPTLLRSLV